MRHALTSVDRRYSETQGAISSASRTDRLIGQYKERAALENRRAGAMGGSVGRPDAYAAQRRGVAQAYRGAEQREKEAVFALARSSVTSRTPQDDEQGLG